MHPGYMTQVIRTVSGYGWHWRFWIFEFLLSYISAPVSSQVLVSWCLNDCTYNVQKNIPAFPYRLMNRASFRFACPPPFPTSGKVNSSGWCKRLFISCPAQTRPSHLLYRLARAAFRRTNLIDGPDRCDETRSESVLLRGHDRQFSLCRWQSEQPAYWNW